MSNTINVRVRFGSANDVQKSYEIPVTIAQVLRDTAAVLSFEVNRVEASLNGVVSPDVTTLRNGDVLVVTTKSCGKAALR